MFSYRLDWICLMSVHFQICAIQISARKSFHDFEKPRPAPAGTCWWDLFFNFCAVGVLLNSISSRCAINSILEIYYLSVPFSLAVFCKRNFEGWGNKKALPCIKRLGIIIYYCISAVSRRVLRGRASNRYRHISSWRLASGNERHPVLNIDTAGTLWHSKTAT